MLSVSSFLFFGIFIISLCLYYIVPKRVQWMLHGKNRITLNVKFRKRVKKQLKK